MRTQLVLVVAASFSALFTTGKSAAQCSPVDCLATLPAHGGMCDDAFNDATVGATYSDSESFHTTSSCFDAAIISPANAGTYIRVTYLDTFTFSGLPTGLTATSNADSYATPANGCVEIAGTPTEIGVFEVQVQYLADVTVTTNSCFSLFGLNDNAGVYGQRLVVKPDASFSIPSTSFTTCDAPVSMIVTGTAGGMFAGPGVNGNAFDPSAAGPGMHVVSYEVSAQEGAAVEPASATSTIMVSVLDMGACDGADGGVADGGVADGGVADGGVADGGVADGSVSDGGVSDGGTMDAGATDGGNAGTEDGGVTTDDGAVPTDDGGMEAMVSTAGSCSLASTGQGEAPLAFFLACLVAGVTRSRRRRTA